MLTTSQREEGFTLIELIISITILGILMAAVSAAMMVGLSTNATTGTRLDESRDEQFIAAYFSADAQGAKTIKAGVGVVATCKFPGGGGTLVVEFVGEDFSDDAALTLTPRTVSYLRRPSPDGGTEELHRLVCVGGAANPGPGEDTTLARNLTPGDWSAGCIFAPLPIGTCVGARVTMRSGSLEYTLTAYKRTDV